MPGTHLSANWAGPVSVQVPAPQAVTPAARPAATPQPVRPAPSAPAAAPRPVPAVATASARSATSGPPRAPAVPRRDGGFKPLEDDQYDIPAFLRRGGSSSVSDES